VAPFLETAEAVRLNYANLEEKARGEVRAEIAKLVGMAFV